MPPENTIQNLQETLPNTEGEHPRNKPIFIIFFLVAIAVAIGIWYYFSMFLSVQPESDTLPVVEKNELLLDAVTGEAISSEEIAATVAAQKVNQKIFVLSGEVISVEKDVILVKTETGTVKVSLSSGGSIMESDETPDSKAIAIKDVKIGSAFMALIPGGKKVSELVSNIIVVEKIEVFPQTKAVN